MLLKRNSYNRYTLIKRKTVLRFPVYAHKSKKKQKSERKWKAAGGGRREEQENGVYGLNGVKYLREFDINFRGVLRVFSRR